MTPNGQLLASLMARQQGQGAQPLTGVESIFAKTPTMSDPRNADQMARHRGADPLARRVQDAGIESLKLRLHGMTGDSRREMEKYIQDLEVKNLIRQLPHRTF